VQEELERHYLTSQAQAERIGALQQHERELQAGREQAEKLALERERLLDEERRLRQTEQKNAAQQLKALQQARSQMEAARADTRQESEVLLNQLHQVQEELERYYLENKKLKSQLKPTPPKPAPLYGAADRVKQQLTYRIGSAIVQHGNSFGGLLRMPWAIRRQIVEFRRGRQAAGQIKLPPITRYADAQEADRVRQHLSYRLGEVFMRHSSSPLGWVQMPFALRREVKTFRAQRAR
jgi:hypothetical protein